ncbi:protein phosphatase 2C 77-like [Papaver somniferum]|uniref:protein phosphatase 2C 77-like n=1 Tax=Papaver somniferum TaxID=3469 RepID=UPI000E6FAAA4|nr:protein phosphatase 2C 77-like [Papaver somniferum]
MEEMSAAMAVPFRLGNLICDSSVIATHVGITSLKLITDTASLISDTSRANQLLLESFDGGYENCSNQVDLMSLRGQEEDNRGRGQEESLLKMVPESEGSMVVADSIVQESEEDDNLSLGGGDLVHDSSCSLSVTSDTSSLCGDEFLTLESASELNRTISMEIDNLEEPRIQREAHSDLVTEAEVKRRVEDDSNCIGSTSSLQVGQDRRTDGPVSRSVSALGSLPRWGSVSICGRRPEMEDAFSVVPQFFSVPQEMLFCDGMVNGANPNFLSHSTGHFFGVYDGHGGPQVADYCRDRFHLALVEELETVKQEFCNGVEIKTDWQMKWEKAITNCFRKVDAEIGATPSSGEGSSEPIAPDTVGSTAVVAMVFSSHLIVSNCGDSRAVLCRGKEAMALSDDHKPNREDEYARIEAAGGKVINWNGSRVFGVLAMSRSIGDKYLKPSVIPDPEVMFVPRKKEDGCLILASDGLWDVMTNEEACEAARKRIFAWHKKNGTTDSPCEERGDGGIDLAAQAAAEYLSKLAIQKGSKDNITVVVVDLKPHRKYKSKT